jgi:diadenylate cyclase
VTWRVFVDFAVLSAGIYVLLRWSRDARALRVTFGILALEAGALASRAAGLVLTSFVLHAAALIAGIALIALFQPELRHAITRLEVTAGRASRRSAALAGVQAIATAMFSLAAARRGAIVVVQQRDSITELVQGGVPLGGQVSVEILEAIFRKVSPVHDGAAVIEGDRITRVGALLPLSDRRDLPRRWGTRHRAAMGLAERSDAMVVVASEERGSVTVVAGGQARTVTNVEELVNVLGGKSAEGSDASRRWLPRRQDATIVALALGLAAAIWATLLVSGNTVQVRSIPLEFTNVGRGLQVVDPSATSVQLRLRGSSWMLDSADFGSLVLRVSLSGVGPGMHTVQVARDGVPLPFGVTADGVSPESVTLTLVPQNQPPAAEP